MPSPRRLAVLTAALAGCGRLAPGPLPPPAAHAYLIRGYLDWYSTGVDRLAVELGDAGTPAAAYREEQWGDLADALLARPVAGRLVLIGFSYGADDVILIARRLSAHGRPVDLLVTIDPVTPAAVPPNVRRCVNFYQPNGIWDAFPFLRGVPLTADALPPQNVDVRARPDLVEPDTSHATIAANEKVHRAILALVRQPAAR